MMIDDTRKWSEDVAPTLKEKIDTSKVKKEAEQNQAASQKLKSEGEQK